MAAQYGHACVRPTPPTIHPLGSFVDSEVEVPRLSPAHASLTPPERSRQVAPCGPCLPPLPSPDACRGRGRSRGPWRARDATRRTGTSARGRNRSVAIGSGAGGRRLLGRLGAEQVYAAPRRRRRPDAKRKRKRRKPGRGKRAVFRLVPHRLRLRLLTRGPPSRRSRTETAARVGDRVLCAHLVARYFWITISPSLDRSRTVRRIISRSSSHRIGETSFWRGESVVNDTGVGRGKKKHPLHVCDQSVGRRRRLRARRPGQNVPRRHERVQQSLTHQRKTGPLELAARMLLPYICVLPKSTKHSILLSLKGVPVSLWRGLGSNLPRPGYKSRGGIFDEKRATRRWVPVRARQLLPVWLAVCDTF